MNMFLRKKMQHRKGFTLIELMVVIAIIGILAAIAIPKFADTTATANGGKVLGDLATIDSAIAMYMATYAGSAPTSFNDLTNNGFLTNTPTKPSGTIKINGNTVTGAYGITNGRATIGTATSDTL